MKENPDKKNHLKIYKLSIISLGFAALLFSFYRFDFAAAGYSYFIFCFVTLVTSSLTAVKIPGVKSHISVSDTFVFLSIILYGGEAGILLSALECTIASYKLTKNRFIFIFNIAVYAAATFINVWTLRFLFGSLPDSSHPEFTAQYFVAVGLMGLIQYLVNSGLIAAVFALRTEKPLWRIWKENFLWTSVAYFAQASAAGIAGKLIGVFGIYAFLATLPVVFVVYFTYTTYLKHAETAAQKAELAQQHVEELSRHAAELLRANETMQAEAHERMRAVEETRKANAETERMLSAIKSILIVIDREGTITRWNLAAAETFGVSEKNAVGFKILEMPIAWDSQTIAESVRDALDGTQAVSRNEVRYTRADGKDGVIGMTLHPYRDERERLMGCLLTAADLTEKRALTAQLQHAQKMETVGQLAAGIAHEINTPTQYVGDNTRFIRDAFDDFNSVLEKYAELLAAARDGAIDEKLIEEVEDAIERADLEYLSEEVPAAIRQSLEGVSRIDRIVQSMRDFAHTGTTEKKAADLNRAVESTITVARNEWKYVADVETAFDEKLPPVPCLLGEFNQVILNMIINATHAIAEKVGDGSEGKGQIKVSTAKVAGEWAEIRIGDSGCGIPPEVQSRIFDPFFTTKEVGKGTGQGLAISHAVVVEKHGGQLFFETEKGNGTTFVIRLPLEAGEASKTGEKLTV